MAENKDPDKPMRYLASDCNELFEDIINTGLANQQQIVSLTVEYRDAFNALTSFLCIFNESDTSLDYRLRKHESMQDIMIRLLELLRQNLFTVSDSVSNQRSDLPLHVVSEVGEALAGIEESLKSLNKFAVTIRQSSRSTALTLARNFATSKRDLKDLEELILISLETLYPNAPESLRNHICNTLTDRYARLEYTANLNGSSRSKTSKQNQGGKATERPSDDEPVQQSSTISRPKTVELDHVQRKVQEESPNMQQRPLSSLDTGLLRQTFNNKDINTSQSKRTLSVYESDGHMHEPLTPKFKAGESEVQCRWCNELLDRSVVRNDRWSNIGRLHYKRDLKPFPCLSESCGESRPSFSSRKQWLEHMRLNHSATWPRALYPEITWVCHDHVEDDKKVTYTFSSQDDLEQHMLLIHHSKKSLSDIEFNKYLEHRPLRHGTTSSSPCPLCSLEVGKSLELEGTSSSQLDVVPSNPSIGVQNKKKDEKPGVAFASDVKAASDVDDINPGNDKDNDPSTVFALELHIAAHLQYLLVVSLRLMETLDHNIEEDSVTGLHGSNDPATRSASSMNDGVKLEDFPDDELALVFISDSERLQLEYMRSNEEAAEDVPLSSEQDQWDDLEFLVQGPTEEDSVLQDFSRKQESHSRIEASRKSIESLLQKSYDVSAESYRWREIGLLQAKIFSETKALDDVNQAIEAFERGVEASTSDHAVLYQNLGDLSSYLLERYKVEAHGDDLGRAIETTKMAIEMTGDTDTRRQGEQLIRLSSLLQWSYCHTYLLDDLNRALEAARDGLGLVPEDSAQRPTCHYRLGQLLTLSYSRTGIETTLDEGIHQLRLALDKAAEEDTEYSEYLATLSTSLDMKFALARSQEELLEAIELMRQSISLITERDSAFLKRLDSLAIMLGELYTTTGAIDALEESIRVARTVVSSTPDDDIHAADRMAHLSDRLEDMFQRTNDLRGLDEAIALSSTAKTITPTDHPSLHVYCHSQATKTFKRYHILKSFTDLEETIALSSQAAKLLPDTDVNTARYICLLADASLELGKTLGDTAQLRESHRLYESGLSHEYSALQERLQAGRKLFIAYIQSQNWNAAYNSARKTIDCLAYVPFADLAHREKELILDTMGWIASEGVAAALNAGRPPLEVLYLLEDSRCLVANSIVFYSEEFKRLRQRYPKKLEEFLAIRKSLKRPISGPPSGLIDNSPWNAQGKRRYEATIDCERLVAEIRSEPGFSNWLVQADETRMLKAGMKGPVIVFNASHIRSDAIIIHRDTVEVVGLPDLDYNDFEAQLDLRNPPTVANALWIWLTIAKPVLTYLGLSPVSSGIYPRLWLIPTGILTNLPIHAAGDYRNPTSESVSMLDYAVCSYSPSVKALTLARERPGLLSDNAKALLLGIEESPASARLVYTTKEISSLHDICRSRGLDVSQPNSKEGVLQALETCELFHFAAVFFNIKDDPLKSHIMLADGSITVKDILDAISRARRPILAYLSSCTTAKTLHRSFADECLHAAGALHIGGFRHAIGAQTIVDDQFCYEFSNLFYGAWPGREVSDDTVALCLHEATRTFMDQWKERELGDGRRDTHRSIVMNEEDDDDDTVMRWAAFIHLGP